MKALTGFLVLLLITPALALAPDLETLKSDLLIEIEGARQGFFDREQRLAFLDLLARLERELEWGWALIPPLRQAFHGRMPDLAWSSLGTDITRDLQRILTELRSIPQRVPSIR